MQTEYIAQPELMEYFPGQITNWTHEGDQITIQTENKVILIIEVFTDHVVRLRYLTADHSHRVRFP